MPGQPKTFRARYDALEQRRTELLVRLEGLGERARQNPGYAGARTLLNATFRKAKLVQRAATRTWAERRPFRDVLGEDPEITAHLTDARLDACFDLDRAVAHAARAVDALDAP